MTNKKVAVIGIGTMGSMTLWQLAKRGIDAVGFEQFGIAHDRSAIGGESRMFRTAYMEGPEYVPLLKQARKQWETLEKETGHNLLTLNGGLMIGPKQSERMKNVVQSVGNYDINYEVLDAKQASNRYPQHQFSEEDIILLDHEAGFMRPELAVFAATERAKELGAIVHCHTKVESIKEVDDKVIIVANGKEHEFDQVVVTAGPWTAKLYPELQKNLKVNKIVMTWYPTNHIENYQVDVFPVFARISEDIQFFGTPTLEGTMVKIASVDTFGEVDPDHLQQNVQVCELKNINQAVHNFFPEFNSDPTKISVHMDGYTSDEHAIVGNIPKHERTFIMGGYSGHGFKLAPIMGEIGADLIETGKTQYDISHLQPSRFMKG